MPATAVHTERQLLRTVELLRNTWAKGCKNKVRFPQQAATIAVSAGDLFNIMKGLKNFSGKDPVLFEDRLLMAGHGTARIMTTFAIHMRQGLE